MVQNIRTLEAMAKLGLIKLTAETGCKIGKSIIHYVDDVCESVSSIFEYKGAKYTLKYTSGCFYPYVYFVENKCK